MAAVTLGVSAANTADNVPLTTGSFTPAANDLLIALAGVDSQSSGGTFTDSQGLGWTQIILTTDNTTSSAFVAAVANTLAANSSMTVTFTPAGGPSSGGIAISVLRVSGVGSAGIGTIRQSAGESNIIGGNTPTPTFGVAALTGNAVISGVFNRANPPNLTVPSGFTQRTNNGFALPTHGLQTASIDSGFTGTSLPWSNSATAFCDLAIELGTPLIPAQPRTIVTVSQTEGPFVTQPTPQPGQTFSQVGVLPVPTRVLPFLTQTSQRTPEQFPPEGYSLSIFGKINVPVVINNNYYPTPQEDYQVAPWFLAFEGSAFIFHAVPPVVTIAPTIPPGGPRVPAESPLPLDRLGPGWAWSMKGRIPIITVAPTIPPGLPKVPVIQAVPYPVLDFGSALSVRGGVLAQPVSPGIPPGLPKVPVLQSVPGIFPPSEKLLTIFTGTAPPVIVKTPLPVQPVQVLPPADLFLQGRAFSAAARFRREPVYIASFLVRGQATYPPQPVFPEQGSVNHVYVSKPLQPFASMPPEIYIYQAVPEMVPERGAAYSSPIRLVTPLPNRPQVYPHSLVVPPPAFFPEPGKSYSFGATVKNPPILPKTVRPVSQEVPPQPIYPPQGIFFFRQAVVIVPTVKTPLPVTAKESTPPYGAMWPPPGITLTYVSARPPFDTSGIEPVTMSDIFAPEEDITGSISN